MKKMWSGKAGVNKVMQSEQLCCVNKSFLHYPLPLISYNCSTRLCFELTHAENDGGKTQPLQRENFSVAKEVFIENVP